MYNQSIKQPITEEERKEERIRNLSYKLDMLLSGIGNEVKQRDVEGIFSSKDYVSEVKSKIDIAIDAGVDINSLGRVSCLNSCLEGCRNLPDVYKEIASQLVGYIIDLGADVVSSGSFYNYMPPLELAEMFNYDDKVISLIKTAKDEQQQLDIEDEPSVE